MSHLSLKVTAVETTDTDLSLNMGGGHSVRPPIYLVTEDFGTQKRRLGGQGGGQSVGVGRVQWGKWLFLTHCGSDNRNSTEEGELRETGERPPLTSDKKPTP